MAEQRRFPNSDHAMWKNDLEALPHLSEGTLAGLCASAGPSSRQQNKSYIFAVEAYTLPSSVSTNICDSRLGIVYARATCFRSQKKTGRPYKVHLAFQLNSSTVTDTTCECAAGTSGSCSHILAALRLMILLKKKFKEAPPELSCTELPQQWRRPRQHNIRPMSVLDVDWRSPREDGTLLPTPAKVYDARAKKLEEQQQLDSFHKLGESLRRLGNDEFAAALCTAKGPFKDTKLGMAPPGSALSYQQKKLPAGFKTWKNIPDGSGVFLLVPELFLFDQAVPHTFVDRFSADEWSILREMQVSPEDARRLELNSRQQARSECWKEGRLNRLTASCFGRVLKRDQWTDKGLRNLIEPKDLSRVRAIQYGQRNESAASDRYCVTMWSLGHHVTLQHCGLVVHPECPWLGASPDRLVYDPEEQTYGVLEVKCPYSLKDSEPEQARSAEFCMTFTENDVPSLKRNHEYYAQVLGQMALTECKWGDFVVCSEKWIVIERICFDEAEWTRMKAKLDSFFFSHMLQYVVSRRSL